MVSLYADVCQGTSVRVVFKSGLPSNSRKDSSVDFDFLHTLLCCSIQISFVDFVLLFSFHYETTTKNKFIFYAKEIGS